MDHAALRRKILDGALKEAGLARADGRVRCVEVACYLDPGRFGPFFLSCICGEPFCMGTAAESILSQSARPPVVALLGNTWAYEGVGRWHVWIGQCPKCKAVWWRIQDIT